MWSMEWQEYNKWGEKISKYDQPTGPGWENTQNKQSNKEAGNSLAAQWLGLCAFAAEDAGSVPDQGTKIPQAVWCGQKLFLRKEKEAKRK